MKSNYDNGRGSLIGLGFDISPLPPKLKVKVEEILCLE